MAKPIETYQHNGCKVEIFTDEDPSNPREEYDHLGMILYVSSRYILGDKSVDREAIEEVQNDPDNICLPVYIHGLCGVTVSTGAFGDRFDSGKCGIIYMSRETAKKNWPGEDYEQRAIDCLKAEVSEFDQYLRGEVYGYVVTDTSGHEDSCWGFFGVEAAKEAANEMCAPVFPVSRPDNNCTMGICQERI